MESDGNGDLPDLTDDERAYVATVIEDLFQAFRTDDEEWQDAIYGEMMESAEWFGLHVCTVVDARLASFYAQQGAGEGLPDSGQGETSTSGRALDAMHERGRMLGEDRWGRRKGERPAIPDTHPPRPEMGDYGRRPDGSRNLWRVALCAGTGEQDANGVVWRGQQVACRVAGTRREAIEAGKALTERYATEWARGGVLYVEPAFYSRETMPGAQSVQWTRLSGPPSGN